MDAFARDVVDALPMTIWTVDGDGTITGANRAWSRFAATNGAPALSEERQVRGLRIWDAITDAGARDQVERAMAVLRDGAAECVSWEFPCSSPTEERIFLMQVTALRGASGGGAAPGFVFSTVDITTSHRSREALIDAGIALSRTIALERVFQEVTRQARRALGSRAVAVALADDATAALRVRYRDGYDDEADAGAALERRLAPHWLDALASGHVVAAHADVGDGGDVVELSAPMTSDEGVVGAITARVEGPESLRRLDEAERVLTTLAAQAAAAVERAWLVERVEQKRRLEAIGEVSTGVAHELRNPLFGISSAAQLLRFRAREDPVVEKNVGRILREVERLNRMVGSLLEYGRPNPIILRPGDPDAVWDAVLEDNRGYLEAKSLVVRRARAAGACCRIDADQLGQVFVNILVNAADAAPEASDLALASELLPNGAWRCRLHNGGPAIPPEALARVFEIFFSTKTGGTGIGLALCQRIVDEHRGSIAIDSAPDQGTTLTVTLPAA